MANFWIFFAVFALIVVVLAIAIHCEPSLHEPPSQQGDSENDFSGDGKKAATEEKPTVAAALYAYARERKTGDEKTAKHNRKIRRWTRAGAIGALIYTFLTTGILIGSVYGLYLTRIQIELTQRPWMQADVTFVSPFTFDAEGGHFSVNLAMKNSGHSPAVNVLREAEVDVLSTRIPEILAKAESVCSDIEQAQQGGGDDLGFTIFSEATPSAGVLPFLIKQADIDARAGVIVVRLYVCIKYRLTFASAYHQTSYIYEIDQRDSPSPNGYKLISPTGGSVQASDLLLLSNPRVPGRTN